LPRRPPTRRRLADAESRAVLARLEAHKAALARANAAVVGVEVARSKTHARSRRSAASARARGS
jgi:hypothetical protein